jgi:hypothetical protein
MDAILSKFDLYPLDNPTSYCIGFTLNEQFVDTIIDFEEGIDDEDYYINKAYDKLKMVLKNYASKQNILGRKIPVPISNPEPINKKEPTIEIRKKPNTLFNKVKVVATSEPNETIYTSSNQIVQTPPNNISVNKIKIQDPVPMPDVELIPENIIPERKVLNDILFGKKPVPMPDVEPENIIPERKVLNDILFGKKPVLMPDVEPIPENIIPERKVLNEILFGKKTVPVQEKEPEPENIIPERKVLNDILFGKKLVPMPDVEPENIIPERKVLNDILFNKIKIIEPVSMPETAPIQNNDKNFTEKSVVIKDTTEMKNLNDILFEKNRKMVSTNNKVDEKLANILSKIRNKKV